MKPFVMLLFIFAIGGHNFASAQSSSSNRRLESEIRRLDLEAARAILKKDEKLIKRFFASDSVTNNPRNSLTFGSDGVIEAARTNVIDYFSFDRTIESVQLRESVAIVMGSEKVVMKALDGTPGSTLLRRYTNIWQKSGKIWKIIARHANVICP